MHITTTRQRILCATVELIKNHGASNLTVKNIALVAHASEAGVNYYFGSKSNLIDAAQDIIVNQSEIETVLQKFSYCRYRFEMRLKE
jgi:AcrR family transcriptional regulator